MTDFKPNPLFQHGVVTTNGDGLTINDVTPLFAQHRQAVVDAQSEAAVAKAEAQKAKDAAEAAARLAEQARQDAETKAAQAAALESKVQVVEEDLARAEAIANTEQIIEETYGVELKSDDDTEETSEEPTEDKPKRAPRARKVADSAE